MSSVEALQYFLTGITVGSVYALTAVGISLVFRSTGWINLLQGEFVMLGGVLASVWANSWPVGISVIVSLAVVGLFAGVSCLVIQIVERRTSIAEALVVVQFAIVGLDVVVVQLIWGTQPQTLEPFTGRTPINIFGAKITPQQLWVIGVLVVGVVCLEFYLKKTWAGRAMRATASNRMGARLSGVRPGSVARRSMVAAGVLGALAGIVVVPSTTMSYNSGITFAIGGFVGAVVGGFGSMPGAVVGGLVVGELQSFSAGVGLNEYSQAIVFALLLVVLLVRRRTGSVL